MFPDSPIDCAVAYSILRDAEMCCQTRQEDGGRRKGEVLGFWELDALPFLWPDR